MIIVGITGTDGAGKGTVVSRLVEVHGFTHYSSRAMIVSEIERRGLPIDRNQMRLIANELRAEYGDDVVVKRALEQAKAEGREKIIVESIRALAEARYLKAEGGVLLAVDADPEIRYARIQERRSASDKVTYEEFIRQEELEKNDPDPHGMQKAKVMEIADYLIMNNAGLEELNNQVDKWVQNL